MIEAATENEAVKRKIFGTLMRRILRGIGLVRATEMTSCPALDITSTGIVSSNSRSTRNRPVHA